MGDRHTEAIVTGLNQTRKFRSNVAHTTSYKITTLEVENAEAAKEVCYRGQSVV